MQRYINQIIRDFQAAKENAPSEPDFGKNYEFYEEKMFAMETAPDISMKKMFGVSYEELPPAERLTEVQMKQLIDAITGTLKIFNIIVDFPNGLPLKLKYELIRDEFMDDIHYMPGWSMHFDFCDGWCPDCKIVNYCSSVDEIWTKEELNAERKNAKSNL